MIIILFEVLYIIIIIYYFTPEWVFHLRQVKLIVNIRRLAAITNHKDRLRAQTPRTNMESESVRCCVQLCSGNTCDETGAELHWILGEKRWRGKGRCSACANVDCSLNTLQAWSPESILRVASPGNNCLLMGGHWMPFFKGNWPQKREHERDPIFHSRTSAKGACVLWTSASRGGKLSPAIANTRDTCIDKNILIDM